MVPPGQEWLQAREVSPDCALLLAHAGSRDCVELLPVSEMLF